MMRQKVAIIGTGISGLSCAHKLAQHHDITLFESADYIGGHTHTVDVEKNGRQYSIDTGFIVFNDRTYPNFIHLMQSLGVEYQPTEMSFSVRNDAIDLEYNGKNLNNLFAQRRNLLRPRFLAMLSDIYRFNREVKAAAKRESDVTLGEFLGTNKYSSLFRDNYLLPMVSAIWSMGLKSCMDFPLKFFVRFFDNHGLLDIINRPQWYSIKGGSRSYIAPLVKPFKDSIRLNTAVTSVQRGEEGVKVYTENEAAEFDQVVFACHADQALSLLADPTEQETSVLQNFRSSENQVVLHTDTSFLPKRRLGWASWNYNMVDAATEQTTLTYNMNILQRLDIDPTFLVTLNQEIPEQHVLQTFIYHHPIYTVESVIAQERWQEISGVNRTHYCGAYWFNGFHEDGVNSGFRVAASLGGEK